MTSFARRSASFALCMLSVALMVIPLWTHRWLPIQDLPEHLATIGVVHGVHAGGWERSVFAVDLAHTQYIIFYVLGDWLSYLVSVRAAGLILITTYMFGIVASLYALLRALGRDPRLCMLIIPLLPNSQFLIGLLQFLIGIPFMFYGWALALDYARERRTRTAIGMAVVAILIFYSHIVVFGLFLIGLAVIAPWRGLFKYAIALVPAGLLCIHWVFFTTSGHVVLNATMSGSRDKDLWPFAQSFHAFYDLVLDSYRDSADEKLFVQAVVIATILTLLGAKELAGRRRAKRLVLSTLRWLIIPAICVFLYFRSEGNNGYLAHIRERFALVALFTVIPMLRMPTGYLGHAGALAMAITAAMSAESFNWHCTQFETYEVADFDAALHQLPPGKRIAGLMYDTESRYFHQNPLVHYPAYYLTERGGTVTFSFAGYPHWAYRYLPHADPLGASPPVFFWEWQPQRVQVREELVPSYEYVLTHGSGFDPNDEWYSKIWEGTGWRVWKRHVHE